MALKPPTFHPRAAPQQREREYERGRGGARKRGYSPIWDKASKAFLRTHPLCLGCQALGIIEPATVTDHVEPHNGDHVKFWCEAMWQPSCRWHHDVIKQQIETLYAVGKARQQDLWLNSVFAMELTRSQRRW